jgi:DNA-binding transcriptional regulator YiaG
MLCDHCNIEMKVDQTNNDNPYRFEKCGLDNVCLVGIELHTCPRCKAVYPIIPRIQELHMAIASILIDKPVPLIGQEIRYLRRWMGVLSQDFAALLGFGPEHLSKVENGRVKLGAAGDRLVRVYAMTHRKQRAFDEISERLAKVKRIKTGRIRDTMLRRCQLLRGQTWRVVEAADAA